MSNYDLISCGPDTEDLEVLYGRIGKASKITPDEQELAQEFNVSIIVVREAVAWYKWLYS